MNERGPGRLALCALLLAGFGCGPAPTGDLATVRVAIRADVTGFYPNPPIVNEGFTIWTNLQVFEGLTGLDSELRAVPALAEGWESPNDTTYVFHLRRGLRFSDGRPLTARDVAASVNAAQTRGWVSRESLQAIRGARALDDRRVEIETGFPYLVLPFRLVRGLVLPADVLDLSPVPPIGTGPYRLERWQPGREFVLARNPHYRGPAPHFDQGRFELLTAAVRRVAEIRPVIPLVIQPEAVATSRRIVWKPPINYALRLADMRPAR